MFGPQKMNWVLATLYIYHKLLDLHPYLIGLNIQIASTTYLIIMCLLHVCLLAINISPSLCKMANFICPKYFTSLVSRVDIRFSPCIIYHVIKVVAVACPDYIWLLSIHLFRTKMVLPFLDFYIEEHPNSNHGSGKWRLLYFLLFCK